MQQTLYLMVGLPGSGKTTKAKEIESNEKAVRFTPDEWFLDLFGSSSSREEIDPLRSPMEQLQWKLGKQLLSLGQSIILDFGFWSKKERDYYKTQAKQIGAKTQIIFCHESIDTLWQRISQRPESQKGTLHIRREELEEWVNMFEKPTEEEIREEIL